MGLAGLVKGENIRFDDKALSGVKAEVLIIHMVDPFSFQYVVNHIIGPDSGAETVEGVTFCIAAEAEVKILNLAVGQLKYERLFHMSYLSLGVVIGGSSLTEGCFSEKRSRLSLWLL